MPNIPAAFCGRISFNASYQYFWNAVKDTSLHNMHAEIDYNLGGKPTYASISCAGAVVSDKELQEKTSLALTYDEGRDKSTLEKRKKIQLQLTFQY